MGKQGCTLSVFEPSFLLRQELASDANQMSLRQAKHFMVGLWQMPGEGNGTPLQYSCLENSMDGGAW